MPWNGTRATGADGRFATTQWSLVLAASRPGAPEAEAALERLCRLYWYPVFAFVRRQGHSSEDAQDLTQGFFARLIEKGDLGAADRSRGRFRSFLLSACQHFLSNERDRARASKRGGGRAPVPIDAAAAEGRYQAALSHAETPERIYERQWCLTLLQAALDGVRADYLEAGNARVFDLLQGFLTADDSNTYAEAGRELWMSEGAVKVAVHRLRRRYRQELRRRVAETVESEHDVEDEIRHLLQTLGPARDGR